MSPLANLTSLTGLGLGNNQISDISLLANLTNLTTLSLSENQISNISLLANLTNLTELGLGNNQISNISSLSNLIKLKQLALDGNQITALSALSGLTDLRIVWLDNNNIADISPLSGLIRIGEVEEDDPWLDEREGIKISIGLRDNQITDIGPLVENEGLSEGDGIDLRGNPLSNYSLNTYIPQLEERGVNVVLYDV